MRIGYSYLRFSSPAQADGDSIRRQTEAARSWCARNDVQLDTSTTYQDAGKSAFRGKHRESGHLAAFLADVEAGRIPRGSVLVIENLDRLSRENPWDAVPLLCSIVNAGVSVVTLSPHEATYERGRDLTPLVLAIIEFGRAYSESASKGDRLTEHWNEKKKRAREDGDIVTRRLPAWIEERGGKLVLIPERAKIVRQIYKLAINGRGLSLIVKHLTESGVQPWGVIRKDGWKPAWSKAYVGKILRHRVAIGEYQPRKNIEGKDGKAQVVPDGEPIPNYYPAVIEEATWQQAQTAMASRKQNPGRMGRMVASLFTGLLWDAQTQSKMLIAWQTRGRVGKNRQKRQVLVSADSMEGRGKSVSFPYAVFETEVLKWLREIRPADVLGEEPKGESAILASGLASLEQRLRAIETELTGDGEDVPALVRAAKALEEKRRDVASRLAAARQSESNPRSAAWGEAQTLIDMAKEEAHRLRLRGLLRQIIDTIYVLIVPRRSHRLAHVQVSFAGGARRDFLIHYWGAGYCRKGGVSSHSMKWKNDSKGKKRTPDLDLRKPEHAKRQGAALQSVNLDDLSVDDLDGFTHAGDDPPKVNMAKPRKSR